MEQKPLAPEISFAVAAMFAAHKVAELPVPTITDVHLVLGISRTAAFKIIKSLEFAGVVDPIQGRGRIITPWTLYDDRHCKCCGQKKAAEIEIPAADENSNASREAQLRNLILSQRTSKAASIAPMTTSTITAKMRDTNGSGGNGREMSGKRRVMADSSLSTETT